MHWSDTTAPLPLFPHMAASQPQPVRVPPWWRRLLLGLLINAVPWAAVVALVILTGK